MLNELYAYVVPTPGGIEKPGAVKNAATRVFYFRIHYALLLLLRDARFFLRRRFLVSFFRKKKKLSYYAPPTDIFATRKSNSSAKRE